MERFKWENENGYRILKIDFSDVSQNDLEHVFRAAQQEIKDKGGENLVVITNIHNVMFDRKTTRLFEKISSKNKDLITISAFHNAGMIQRMAIEAIGKLTDRKFHVFKTEDELKVWMSEKLN